MHLSSTLHERPHVVRRGEFLLDAINFEILNAGALGIQSKLVELVGHLDAERFGIPIVVSSPCSHLVDAFVDGSASLDVVHRTHFHSQVFDKRGPNDTYRELWCVPCETCSVGSSADMIRCHLSRRFTSRAQKRQTISTRRYAFGFGILSSRPHICVALEKTRWFSHGILDSVFWKSSYGDVVLDGKNTESW